MLALSGKILKWYDAHARDLPWRITPRARAQGARPDPYCVWLSEIMLQQTTVRAVAPRYAQFLARWPTVEAMAAASIDDVLGEWAGLGYYARARNLHKCALAVAACGGFPDTEDQLRALPGIGPYTAAAIAAIAFDRRAVVVDGNVERVASRLFAIETPLPKSKAELKAAIGGVWPAKRSGDFAQALMDIGSNICTPRNPKCLLCPARDHCRASAKGIAGKLPVKLMKALKPTRRGIAYALINTQGDMLFERRPGKGLLAGCLGLPGTDWMESKPAAAPPVRARWRHSGTVRHTFTHFHLELEVMAAAAPKTFRIGEGQQWLAPGHARLPTVMRKAIDAAMAHPTAAEAV
ncbi:MAG: A/G-specific adenine glycosylase [Parvularculaceae bacterium]